MNFDIYINKFIFLLYFKYANLYESNSSHYDDYNVTIGKQRIINGEDVTEMYPYLVSIQIFGSHHCAGSIISPHWILTAAHCLVNRISKRWYRIKRKYCGTLAGTVNLENVGEYRHCSRLHVHPYYSEMYNDIGMIYVRLRTPYTLPRIALASTIDIENCLESDAHTTCIVMGWGRWKWDPKTEHSYTNLLKVVNIPLLKYNLCKLYYPRGEVVEDIHVCTKETGKDVCCGDSGGPLVCNGLQYGIVSWSRGCKENKGKPVVYTRVDYHSEWIQATIDLSNRLTQSMYLVFVITFVQQYYVLLFL